MYFSCSTYCIMSRSYTNVADSEATATNKRCTISLDPKVYLRLKDEGIFGESFSELVGRLLDFLKEKRGLEQEGKAVTNGRSI
jgi:predicted CopG family antitoxin